METKKRRGFGFRGWMLVIYQCVAFFAYIVFVNYPMNILADLYGGAQRLTTIYMVCTIIGIVLQLIMNLFVGKIKNMKAVSSILGAIMLALGVCIMMIPFYNATLWCVCYGVETVVGVMYATFACGILVGQWFPTRKGVVMGIATLSYPIGNGVIGLFANMVFKDGGVHVFNAFLPFLIISIIGWVIGLIFIKDYPEQCGCYRDNDRSMTPEVAQAMMQEEIENKKTSVWKIGATLKCGQMWLLVLPIGAMLVFSVGMMAQTAAIIGVYENELAPIGGFAGVMAIICIVGCIGSALIGLLDTKLGTKRALTIAVAIMLLSGILGVIPRAGALVSSLICVAICMGASSNFNVSVAAQFWRREDFGNVFAVISPVASTFSAIGPMIIVRLFNTTMGYQAIFLATIFGGVIGLILVLLFKPNKVKERDDKYRLAAGKPIDDVLEGR